MLESIIVKLVMFNHTAKTVDWNWQYSPQTQNQGVSNQYVHDLSLGLLIQIFENCIEMLEHFCAIS